MISLQVAEEEHATILAALRWWQLSLDNFGEHRSQSFRDIASNCGEFEPLWEDDIDDLFERINYSPEVTPMATGE